MKRLAVIFLLFLSACAIAVPVGHVSDFKQIRDVSYQIHMDNGTCSAVAISPTELLTAGHCIEQVGQQVTVLNDKVVVGSAITVKDNDILDLALLKFNGVFPVYASITSQDALQDEIVAAVGYPQDIYEIVTLGRYQGLLDGEYLTTASVFFGNSGGGLFAIRNGEWQLLGIVNKVAASNYQVITHISLAVTNYHIQHFIGYGSRDQNQEYPSN